MVQRLQTVVKIARWVNHVHLMLHQLTVQSSQSLWFSVSLNMVITPIIMWMEGMQQHVILKL